MADAPSAELRRRFHDRMAAIRDRVDMMGHAVATTVEAVTAAIVAADPSVASSHFEDDAVVDAAYAWLEEEVFGVAALQAPVGRDLRFLSASLRIGQELERCGDLVTSIARRAEVIVPLAVGAGLLPLIGRMGGEAADMVRQALAAYAVIDPVTAKLVVARDDGVDDMQRQLLGFLFRLGDGPVEPAVELAMIARFYERIADHAVVIAERVCWVASATMSPGDSDESVWSR